MCIIVDEDLAKTMAPIAPSTSQTTTTTTTTNMIQIMKPKLSRKITRTPKINLNKYWGLFENIMESGGGVRRANAFDETDMNNEINENISNEQREIDEILVRRNNERNSGGRCTCHFCLITDLRNVTVSERNEQVTEL